MADLKIWIIPCVMFGIFLALITAVLVYTYSDIESPFGKTREINQSVTSMQAFQEAMDATLKK